MPWADAEVRKEYHKQYYQKNKNLWVEKRKLATPAQKRRASEYMSVYRLKTVYGMTKKDYAELLEKQFCKCAICGTDKVKGNAKQLHVDHCHATNKVRGLLCLRCNTALGWYEKNLTGISKYLRDHQ